MNFNAKDYVTTWVCGCSEFGRQEVMAIQDLDYLPLHSPCDLCMYNLPSSTDGKPCSMCPACAVQK